MDIAKDDKYYIQKQYLDVFLQMNDTAKNKDFNTYFGLIDRLEDMCTVSLDREEMEQIREIRMLMRYYTEKTGEAGSDKIQNSNIVRRDVNARIAAQTEQIVPAYIKYPLYRVICRMCIDSMKRTVMATAAGGSQYSAEKDLKAVKVEIEYDLKKFGCVFE